MKRVIFFLLSNAVMLAFGQSNELDIESCYKLLESNYPLSKQKEFIDQNGKLEQDNVRKNYLPTVSLSAQATYQSAVTEVKTPIPNLDIPHPNKDQYKATLNVNQVLYDGGINKASGNVKSVSTEVQQQQLVTSLFQLKERVNRFYFSILLLQEKKKLLNSLRENLIAKQKETKSAIDNGVILPVSEDLIHVEILKIDQQLIALDTDNKSLRQALSQLLGSLVDENVVFKYPAETTELNSNEINRPELKTYELEKKQLDASAGLVRKTNMPILSAFAQGGYANPGLNMLDNTFQPYYYMGIRLNWNLFDWNISKNKQQMFFVQKKMIDSQKETFELSTKIAATQLEAEIDKQVQLIRMDDEIIKVRRSIVKMNESQLKNGTITSSQYITEIVALNEAEINKQLHEVQLLSTKADYKLTLGKVN